MSTARTVLRYLWPIYSFFKATPLAVICVLKEQLEVPFDWHLVFILIMLECINLINKLFIPVHNTKGMGSLLEFIIFLTFYHPWCWMTAEITNLWVYWHFLNLIRIYVWAELEIHVGWTTKLVNVWKTQCTYGMYIGVAIVFCDLDLWCSQTNFLHIAFRIIALNTLDYILMSACLLWLTTVTLIYQVLGTFNLDLLHWCRFAQAHPVDWDTTISTVN